MCQDHWDRLRALIDERGLTGLVAPDGVVAAEQMKDQLERGLAGDEEATTPVNYDPLMAAFWMIASNATDTIGQASPGAVIYLLAGPDAPEDPVEGYGDKFRGRTWPRCALCYLNLAHEVSCKDERCKLDQERGYDWMLERAADDAKAQAIELGMVSADA